MKGEYLRLVHGGLDECEGYARAIFAAVSREQGDGVDLARFAFPHARAP